MNLRDEEQALLRVISANPDEDTPRLMYADWLDENAGRDNSFAARAELIRTQIDLETGIERRTGLPLTTQLAEEFGMRSDALLAAHRVEWEGPIRDALGDSCREVTFHRGFPHAVMVSDVRRLIDSEILAADINTLTDLTVRGLGDQLPELLSHQGIAKIRKLNLRDNYLGDAGAEILANTPLLVNLTIASCAPNESQLQCSALTQYE